MSIFFHFLAKSSLHHRSNLTLVSNVCQAALISLFWALTDSTNYWECIICEFPLILIGKQTMEFLTDQSWSAVKSCYTGGTLEQGFQCCFADGLNQRVVLSATRPATPKEDKLPLKPPSRRDVALILVWPAHSYSSNTSWPLASSLSSIPPPSFYRQKFGED